MTHRKTAPLTEKEKALAGLEFVRGDKDLKMQLGVYRRWKFMANEYGTYWERSWKEEEPDALYKYLDMYYGLQRKEIDIFKKHHIVNVCDAACGFGAYSLAFASNGFHVESFDISETAVEITRKGLKKYGFDAVKVKAASILDTGYPSGAFDGVIAHAVLDHLLAEDARKALNELFRITVPNGLILLSFDVPEEDDFSEEHMVLRDGTMQYTDGSRKGMLFRPYGWEQIEELLGDHDVIYQAERKREKTVIIKK